MKFDDLRQRFLSIDSNDPDPDKAIKRIGTMAGRRVKELADAGTPGIEQCKGIFPPPTRLGDDDDELWWMAWNMFCLWLANNLPEHLPRDFGGSSLKSSDKRESISISYSTFPPENWQRRAHDHAAACEVLDRYLAERLAPPMNPPPETRREFIAWLGQWVDSFNSMRKLYEIYGFNENAKGINAHANDIREAIAIARRLGIQSSRYPNETAVPAELNWSEKYAVIGELFAAATRTGVGTPAAPADGAGWKTVTEIAEGTGLSKSAITKACDKGKIISTGSGHDRRIEPASAMEFKAESDRRKC